MKRSPPDKGNAVCASLDPPGRAPVRPGRTTVPPVPPSRDRWKVLGEGTGTLAFVLWARARTVHLWADTAPANRPRLLVPGTRSSIQALLPEVFAECPALEAPLLYIERLRTDPTGVRTDRLIDACLAIHSWAETHDYLETAFQFAEAAALLRPEDPGLANTAGRAARRISDASRSINWYERAIALAEGNNAPEFIRAQLGCGGAYYHLGEYGRARAHILKGARAAVRCRRRGQAAEARHDLLTLEIEAGDYAAGEDHARRALELYPIGHPRLPYFAHDVAHLFVRNRFYTPAQRILDQVIELITSSNDRVLVWGLLGHAAGAARCRPRFEEAVRHVHDLAVQFDEHAPAAFAHLGVGATALGDGALATDLAGRATALADERGVAEPRRLAALILGASGPETLELEEIMPPGGARVYPLTSALLARLAKWRSRCGSVKR